MASNSSPILPDDVLAKEFNAAIEEFKKIVGDPNHVERVELSTLIDGDYHNNPRTHDLYHMFEKERFVASAIVKPGSTEEVQAIVKVANEFKIPLWVTSMGRNLGYGGAARKTQKCSLIDPARVYGSVLLDVGARMNRILEVNEKFAYALLEPGVTFFDLYNYIQKHMLKLWIDVPDLGGGSILGNTTERGGINSFDSVSDCSGIYALW